MLTLLALAAVYGAYRGLRATWESLRPRPRDNDDRIVY